LLGEHLRFLVLLRIDDLAVANRVDVLFLDELQAPEDLLVLDRECLVAGVRGAARGLRLRAPGERRREEEQDREKLHGAGSNPEIISGRLECEARRALPASGIVDLLGKVVLFADLL